ncbi:hypothetical protein HZH68_014800 [Vespula germanica]|uniref:Uncharacterized protein n=1 Tax=Vespula germanica TaxID=30212 RepID=A0A834J8S9_VESGE|nr:hypothetical protein HZH68_014800 [Vespula germanica]
MICEEVARVVTVFQESRCKAGDDKTYGHKFSETIWLISSSSRSSSSRSSNSSSKSSNGSSSSSSSSGGGDDGGGVVVVVVVVVVIVVIVERRCPGFIDRWSRVTPLYTYI